MGSVSADRCEHWSDTNTKDRPDDEAVVLLEGLFVGLGEALRQLFLLDL